MDFRFLLFSLSGGQHKIYFCFDLYFLDSISPSAYNYIIELLEWLYILEGPTVVLQP